MRSGLRQPALINDWSEVILHDRMSDSERNVIAAVMRTFQEDLKALGQTIIERNKSREKPFMAMNPLNLECSVSI